MNILNRMSCYTKCLTFPLLVGVVLFYVGFHMLHGDHGLIGRAIEMRKQEQLQAKLADISAERERIEHNISLLSGSEVDADLLGELARKQLALIDKNEIVIVD